jgi:hypothetical protein
MRTVGKSLALAIALVAVGAAAAGDVYRWTDDEGRTQVSDTVPEKYRARAKRIDIDKSKPTERERTESLDRTRRDKERAGAMEKSRQGGKEAAQPAASGPSRAKQAGNPNETPCEKAYREYQESQACYAPFHTATSGGVKEEAFKQCGAPVADPSPRCGPPRQ